MDKTAEVLLSLLRTALSGCSGPVEDNVDWQGVAALAGKQGVRGLAFEALEQLRREGASGRSFPDKAVLMQWYGQTAFVEREYARHLSQTKEITELWREAGIRTIVFKGLAHSRYYPQPAHREFGDFDCFLIAPDGGAAYREGNALARRRGLAVDDGWYKHSHIAYKRLTVENHRFFTAARRGGTDRMLNEYILRSIGGGTKLDRLEGTDIYVLPVVAEGLFMLYHSLTHFLVEGICLRHFCDWACWMKANQDRMEWPAFYGLCKRFGLDGFADVLNTIAVRYLGLALHDRTVFADSPYARRTVESALYDESSIYNRGKGRWYERFHVIGNAFRYSWKYRYVARQSMTGYLWQFVYGFVRRSE